MSKPVTITVPSWLPDLVRQHGITEKEAAEMLKWAFDQVHIAAAIYAVARPPRLG